MHFLNLSHSQASITHHHGLFFFNLYKVNWPGFGSDSHKLFLMHLRFVIFFLLIISCLNLLNFCFLVIIDKYLLNLVLEVVIDAVKILRLLILNLLRFFLDLNLLLFVIMLEIRLVQGLLLFNIVKVYLHFLFLLFLKDFSYWEYCLADFFHFLVLLIALCCLLEPNYYFQFWFLCLNLY